MKGDKSDSTHNFVFPLLLALLLAGFVILLCHYGETVLPVFPDESLFLQPARNLTEGKGMGTPALDNLLPGIAHRTYWQPPVYFLAMAAWGTVFGFDIAAARWFSRLCGVGVLLLLWLIAHQWGIPKGLAFLCVLWTASDLAFQYNANLGRMDALNALLLLTALAAFTAYQRDRKGWRAGLAGLSGTLATLTHFIAIPAVAALLLTLLLQRDKRGTVWFLLPLLVGWLLWLAYAVWDWTGFCGQLAAQFARKGETGWQGLLLKLPFLNSLVPFYGVFPVNTPPLWFGLLVVSLLAWWRRHFPLTSWQLGCFTAVYLAATIGGELWYVGWFTPFGYLLLTVWLRAFGAQHKALLLGAFCLALLGYQWVQVARVVKNVPTLSQQTQQFFAEITTVLPQGACVVLHGVPDPFPFLERRRPDVRMVQLSPTPMPAEALESLEREADFFVGIKHWGEGRGFPLPFNPMATWSFRAPTGGWSVGLYPLKVKRRGNAFTKQRQGAKSFWEPMATVHFRE